MFSELLNIEELLKQGQKPDGPWPNLAYDNRYYEVEALSVGQPADSMVPGSRKVPPNWPAVMKLLPPLLAESRDLRLGVLLCRALATLEGMVGAAVGLRYLAGLLEHHWTGLHPLLDPDDNDDPTVRLNVLRLLLDPPEFIDLLLSYKLVTDPFSDAIELGTLMRVQSEGAVLAGEPVVKQLQGARDACSAIDRIMAALPDPGMVDFTPLTELFGQIIQLLDPESATKDATGPSQSKPQSLERTPATTFRSGPIRGTADVTAAIDAICTYYAAAEPSSPVPMLLRRARRLVGADFHRILRDLVPAGIADFERVSGVPVPALPDTSSKP